MADIHKDEDADEFNYATPPPATAPADAKKSVVKGLQAALVAGLSVATVGVLSLFVEPNFVAALGVLAQRHPWALALIPIVQIAAKSLLDYQKHKGEGK